MKGPWLAIAAILVGLMVSLAGRYELTSASVATGQYPTVWRVDRWTGAASACVLYVGNERVVCYGTTDPSK